ncbi:MAG: CcmD family protein [Myxococcales bacterium]|nr:CcmD family protein [Myxococcales bacterium]
MNEIASTAPPPRDLSAYKEEPVPGGALLVVAYAVVWVLVFVWIARLALRQTRLEREVHALSDRVDGGAEP